MISPWTIYKQKKQKISPLNRSKSLVDKESKSKSLRSKQQLKHFQKPEQAINQGVQNQQPLQKSNNISDNNNNQLGKFDEQKFKDFQQNIHKSNENIHLSLGKQKKNQANQNLIKTNQQQPIEEFKSKQFLRNIIPQQQQSVQNLIDNRDLLNFCKNRNKLYDHGESQINQSSRRHYIRNVKKSTGQKLIQQERNILLNQINSIQILKYIKLNLRNEEMIENQMQQNITQIMRKLNPELFPSINSEKLHRINRQDDLLQRLLKKQQQKIIQKEKKLKKQQKQKKQQNQIKSLNKNIGIDERSINQAVYNLKKPREINSLNDNKQSKQVNQKHQKEESNSILPKQNLNVNSSMHRNQQNSQEKITNQNLSLKRLFKNSNQIKLNSQNKEKISKIIQVRKKQISNSNQKPKKANLSSKKPDGLNKDQSQILNLQCYCQKTNSKPIDKELMQRYFPQIKSQQLNKNQVQKNQLNKSSSNKRMKISELIDEVEASHNKKVIVQKSRKILIKQSDQKSRQKSQYLSQRFNQIKKLEKRSNDERTINTYIQNIHLIAQSKKKLLQDLTRKNNKKTARSQLLQLITNNIIVSRSKDSDQKSRNKSNNTFTPKNYSTVENHPCLEVPQSARNKNHLIDKLFEKDMYSLVKIRMKRNSSESQQKNNKKYLKLNGQQSILDDVDNKTSKLNKQSLQLPQLVQNNNTGQNDYKDSQINNIKAKESGSQEINMNSTLHKFSDINIIQQLKNNLMENKKIKKYFFY